eukprot:1946785-Rhodomonas_salina.1
MTRSWEQISYVAGVAGDLVAGLARNRGDGEGADGGLQRVAGDVVPLAAFHKHRAVLAVHFHAVAWFAGSPVRVADGGVVEQVEGALRHAIREPEEGCRHIFVLPREGVPRVGRRHVVIGHADLHDVAALLDAVPTRVLKRRGDVLQLPARTVASVGVEPRVVEGLGRAERVLVAGSAVRDRVPRGRVRPVARVFARRVLVHMLRVVGVVPVVVRVGRFAQIHVLAGRARRRPIDVVLLPRRHATVGELSSCADAAVALAVPSAAHRVRFALSRALELVLPVVLPACWEHRAILADGLLSRVWRRVLLGVARRAQVASVSGVAVTRVGALRLGHKHPLDVGTPFPSVVQAGALHTSPYARSAARRPGPRDALQTLVVVAIKTRVALADVGAELLSVWPKVGPRGAWRSEVRARRAEANVWPTAGREPAV